MPAPTTTDDFLHVLRRSNLLEPARLEGYLAANPEPFDSAAALCRKMRADGLITPFHAEQLLRGKHRGFFLGKYKLLDRIGFGGMGQVFLAEHTSMRRRVALKVMPPDRASNSFSRERFLREARAAGQLDHPNLVRAFDIDQDGDVIFLVMEYVDGVSFHDLVARTGPLTPERAGYYLWQAAYGLSHLHACGLVHRDIKPANLIVDRQGVVKILDLGLVRSEADGDDLTRGEGVKILGTADYLAPEQAINCSGVDIRADIYGLGATGFFLLTGHPPFEGGKVTQKLIAHQMKKPKLLHEVRHDVPVGLSELIARMMAKKPDERFQTPAELARALAPWAQVTPPLPTEKEIPPLAAVSYGAGSGTGSSNTSGRHSGGLPNGDSRGSGSGSDIRYQADSAPADVPESRVPTEPTPLPVRLAPTTVTPVPRPGPTPKSKSRGPRPAPPPLLPAEATHGRTPPPSDPEPIDPALALFPPTDLAELTTGPSADLTSNSVRRWVVIAIAVTLILILGTWNMMKLFGAAGGPDPAAQPDTGRRPGLPRDIRKPNAGPAGGPLASASGPSWTS
jgi:serine/threonine protein kinase